MKIPSATAALATANFLLIILLLSAIHRADKFQAEAEQLRGMVEAAMDNTTNAIQQTYEWRALYQSACSNYDRSMSNNYLIMKELNRWR